MSITVRCNAKVNLYLKVYGIREDGFHNLISMMQSVQLTDILFIEETDSGKIEIECSNPDIPTDESNLVWRAASILSKTVKKAITGLKIHIEKNIPAMGGLAGGSSNAAGVMHGLNAMWNLGIDDRQIIEIAVRVGSDVPFCYVGSTCLVGGRGEIVEPMPVQISTLYPDSAFVLVFPSTNVNTAAAYGLIDKHHEKSGEKAGMPQEDHDMIRDAWVSSINSGEISSLFYNEFETPVFNAYPDLAAVAQNVRNHFGHALMSGSGSTIAAWFDSMPRALTLIDTYIPIAGETCIAVHPADKGIVIDILD